MLEPAASLAPSIRRRARWWGTRAFELVPTRRAALALFALAYGVFWLEALAWPLTKGRDLWDYLSYYLQLFHGHTVFPAMMAFRTPVTPLVLGIPLSLGGATLLEIVLGILYAVAVVAWSAVALRFGRWAAVLTAAIVLAYPGFATLYHEASSDAVSATGFALWVFLVVRGLQRPSVGRFAAIGLGVAALALTRPANQVLLCAVLLPLAAAGRWRARLGWAVALLVAAVLPLAAWAVHNGIRYDAYTVSRGRSAFVPFYDEFLVGRISAQSGPASRRLARVVERDVLTLPPYRALHEDVATYFEAPSNYEAVRLFGLADRVGGWSSNSALIHAAGVEALQHGGGAHDGKRRGKLGYYLSGPLHSVWKLLNARLVPDLIERRRTPFPPPTPTAVIKGHVVPNPAALGPNLPAIGYGFFWCASDDIDRCILKDPSVSFSNPATQRRYTKVVSQVRAWNNELPARDGSAWVARQLSRATWHFPRAWMFLVVGALAVAIRRPRGSVSLIAIALLAGPILAVHAVVTGPDPQYGTPVYPALFLFGVCALVGERRRE